MAPSYFKSTRNTFSAVSRYPCVSLPTNPRLLLQDVFYRIKSNHKTFASVRYFVQIYDFQASLSEGLQIIHLLYFKHGCSLYAFFSPFKLYIHLIRKCLFPPRFIHWPHILHTPFLQTWTLLCERIHFHYRRTISL